MLEGFKRKFKPLEILTVEQVDAIWEGILNVLEKHGLKFDVKSPTFLKVFAESGCKVDYDTKMVKFPPDLVTNCLSKCPSTFELNARDPNNNIIIGGDRVYVQSGGGTNYMDIETFEPRLATKKEYYDAVTVYDALPNFHLWHPLSPHTLCEGVPPAMENLENIVARLRNSTKANTTGPTVLGDHIFGLALSKIFGVNMLWLAAPEPPLTWTEEKITATAAAIEAGCPLSFSSGAMWGVNAPTTIAGSLISASVETIGMVVFTQLIHPRHPVRVSLFTFPQNMHSGAPFFGNITIALNRAAFYQVMRRYNIPTGDTEPALTNSKCMDFQSGYEKGMLALAAAVSGAHTFWLHGSVSGELTAHPVQAIMDDDIAGMVGRFIEGVEVSDETMAVDLIKQIGTGPDVYLNKKHTRKWWRNDQYIPAVADTSTLPEWLQEGKKTTIDLAKEKMEEILATHKVSIPVTASQEEEIERILAEARKFYKEKGMM